MFQKEKKKQTKVNKKKYIYSDIARAQQFALYSRESDGLTSHRRERLKE